VGLGQTDRALDLLEKAYEDREGRLISLNVEPEYDPLRAAPRFQSLLNKDGLPFAPVTVSHGFSLCFRTGPAA